MLRRNNAELLHRANKAIDCSASSLTSSRDRYDRRRRYVDQGIPLRDVRSRGGAADASPDQRCWRRTARSPRRWPGAPGRGDGRRHGVEGRMQRLQGVRQVRSRPYTRGFKAEKSREQARQQAGVHEYAESFPDRLPGSTSVPAPSRHDVRCVKIAMYIAWFTMMSASALRQEVGEIDEVGDLPPIGSLSRSEVAGRRPCRRAIESGATGRASTRRCCRHSSDGEHRVAPAPSRSEGPLQHPTSSAQAATSVKYPTAAVTDHLIVRVKITASSSSRRHRRRDHLQRRDATTTSLTAGRA
jgi:hypothetical protein